MRDKPVGEVDSVDIAAIALLNAGDVFVERSGHTQGSLERGHNGHGFGEQAQHAECDRCSEVVIVRDRGVKHSLRGYSSKE